MATKIGTSGNDTLIGSSENDTLLGGEGNDLILGAPLTNKPSTILIEDINFSDLVGAMDFPESVPRLMAVLKDSSLVLEGNSMADIGNSFLKIGKNGELDKGFGNGGLLSLAVALGDPDGSTISLDSTETAVSLLSDGKFLVSGLMKDGEMGVYARLDSNGKLDTTFGSSGFFDPNRQINMNKGESLIGQFGSGDAGFLIVKQAFPADRSEVVFQVHDQNGKLSGSSSLLDNGDFDFAVLGGPEANVMLQGKKVILEVQSTKNTAPVLLRLTDKGSIDTTFGVGGFLELPSGAGAGRRFDYSMDSSIEVRQDGIYITGVNVSGGTSPAQAVLKFTVDGKNDKNFAAAGTLLISGDSAMDSSVFLLPDGRILFEKRELAPAQGTSFQIFPKDGKVPAMSPVLENFEFGAGAGAMDSEPFLAVQGTKILVQGSSTMSMKPLIARLNGDGSLDTTFGSNGIFKMPEQISGEMADYMDLEFSLQSDGKILATGIETMEAEGASDIVIRLTADGRMDAGFGEGGILSSDAASEQGGFFILPDGKILFLQSDLESSSVTLYNRDGQPDSLFGNDPLVADSLLGGGGVDTLIAGGGNDTLDGGAGADLLRGMAGNDFYIIDNAGDVVFENTASGSDTIRSVVAHTLGANIENLQLAGSAAIAGTGNSLDNLLVGNSAANNLSGGTGNDSLLGGAGNDTLNAGVGTDLAKGEAGRDHLRIDWSGLKGANITRSVRRDGTGSAASFSGTYTAKNASGALLSQVAFESIETLDLNGKTVDLNTELAVAGVTIDRTSSSASTDEQGGKVQYSVVLNKAPYEPVAIEFKSSDETEGRVLNPRLVFTATNWNTPQTLTVQGVDDYLDDGNIAYTVNGKIVTEDLFYNRITVKAFSLVNNDDTEDKPLNLKGTQEIDRLVGKNGNDRIYGYGDLDSIRGGRGDDLIYGHDDDDRLFGDEGNDKLYGGYDNDRMEGGLGADSLFGEEGLDTMLGGEGNDYLDGGLENDSMSGGAGNDTYFVDSAGDKINDLGLSTDVDTVLVLQTINYTLPSNIENASINTPGNANLTGNTLNNGLTGNDGRNVLDGGSGNDKLDGGAGADSLLGGVGNDAMIGGAGNDTMRGGDGVDLADFAAAGVDIRVDLSTGRVTGEGTDLLFDIENILAGEGQDTLLGNTGANDLDGGAGIDSLSGGGGNDTLAGCFFGANGGRAEIDTLAGGVGNDIFQLGWASGRFYDDGNTANAGRNDYVLITDFAVGQDKLQLDGAAAGYYLGASGVSGVTGTGLWAEQGATDELIAIIRSANSTALNAANTVNTALFV